MRNCRRRLQSVAPEAEAVGLSNGAQRNLSVRCSGLLGLGMQLTEGGSARADGEAHIPGGSSPLTSASITGTYRFIDGLAWEVAVLTADRVVRWKPECGCQGRV